MCEKGAGNDQKKMSENPQLDPGQITQRKLQTDSY
jgi:hypothetical protein